MCAVEINHYYCQNILSTMTRSLTVDNQKKKTIGRNAVHLQDCVNFFFACPKLHFVLQLLACKEGEQVAAVDSLFQSRLFD